MKNMKSKSLLAIAFLGVTVLACNNAEESTPEETTPAVEDVAFVNEEGVLQLNNGAKWKANTETTAGVEKMQAQISEFKEMNLPENLINYKQLSSGLNTTMQGIFEQCTMKGAAHDELHDFLVPIKGNITTLGGDDLEAAGKAFSDIQRQLSQFDIFFE